MGSFSASLAGCATTLDALQNALNVTQNNIENATTPGYARQQATLIAAPFDLSAGLTGGLLQGPTVDSRDLLTEQDVWLEAGAQGQASAQNEALTAVQNTLPVSSGSGIPAALTNFFSAASSWSVAPNSSTAAQAVIDSAGALAQTFQSTAAAVTNVSQNLTQGIGDTVNQINGLTAQLAELNAQAQQGGQHDAGLSAQIYNTLESLSGLVNIQGLAQPDGTVQVTLAGGEPLVLGSRQYALTAGSAAAPAAQPVDSVAPSLAAIYAPDGSDVTAQITSGALAGQLQVRNTIIPGLIGDAAQTGALNQAASALAQSVNQIVSKGYVSAGNPAATGLFVTDPNHPDAAASSLALDPGMSASGLPAIDASSVPNGVPLALAALANTPQTALGNTTFTSFYGNTAGHVGSQLDQAQSNQASAAQSLAQAQSMRHTSEGVDLNAEAINVLQLQQGYEAAAKLVNTLTTLSQTLINMVPSA